MHVTLPIFERRSESEYEIATVGLGPLDRVVVGRSVAKLEQRIADDLRTKIGQLAARELAALDVGRNVRLERVRVEVILQADAVTGAGATLGKRKVSGVVPVVLATHWVSDKDKIDIACHPLRPTESWPVRPEMPLDEQARLYFATVWKNLPNETLGGLWCRGKETMRRMAFSARAKSLLDELPDDKAPPWDLSSDPTQRDPRKKQRGGYKVLRTLGVNLSSIAAHKGLTPGLPSGATAAKLGELLSASKRKSAVVVGAPSSGKTTAIHRAIVDALEADGYFLHRNLDRCREAWLVSGKRLIAGMSYLGEWEQRCLDLIDDARRARVVLIVEDLHHFGRIGRSRHSERCLADLFRGPIARREVVVVGECTPEGMRLLEEEAPALASLLAPIPVPEATRSETFRLLLHEARDLDQRHDVRFAPLALRSLVDLSTTLIPGRAMPGKAIDLARELARARAPSDGEPAAELDSAEVLALLSERTGMPKQLLSTDEPLDHEDVERALAAQVIGQPDAVRAMVDLVMRVKVGAVDPRRPFGVFLFTGPTGTGKTELAKCLAEYLYGSAARLLRFDMSELSGPDAAARLIGDRWAPEGLLTTAVQQQPYAVVLLDEIEKAHRSVHHLFLQLFEDGQLTDAAGVTAHFAHTVVIMTSNLGGRARTPVGFDEKESARAANALMADVARAVREFFSPELLNRIDRIVPFRPLTMDVATKVAAKELDKMLARRGLAERNIFVSRSPAVTRRVAEVAFRAEDGARSIKRHLESTIGAELSEAITQGARGAIQMFHVDEGPEGKGFAVERQVLAEVEPISASFALESLLGLSAGQLRAHLAEALEMVRSLEYGGDVTRLSAELSARLADHNEGQAGHADVIHEIEVVRHAVATFRTRLERAVAATDREAGYEAMERARFSRLELGSDKDGMVARVLRLFDRRSAGGNEGPMTKQEMLACLAESHFLRRAIERAREPGQHAIFVELRPVGAFASEARFEATKEGLLEWLDGTYSAGYGELDGWAYRDAEGKVLERVPRPEQRVVQVVLKIVGLCVLDHYELEQGTHVRHALASGPELVRVRVVPAAPGETAGSFLRAQATDRTALPVVRTLRFDPPEPGALAPCAIEDYAVAWTSRREARSLADALAPLFLYRASRLLLPSTT